MPSSAVEAASPLLESLRARIRRDGPIGVDDYMRACLTDPEHGYYIRGNGIGAGGDFVTAPEISQVFGELIGLWCAVAWESMRRPAAVRLVELGPGRGTLMRDALRAARVMPDFLRAASVHLVEISPPLREVQRRTLMGGPVRPAWHQALSEVPPGPAIIVANEFLDALPIRQLVRAAGAWHERVIDIDAAGRLQFATGPVVAYESEGTPELGAIAELRAGEDEVLAALAAREGQSVALFIDYGPAAASCGDTLQAVRDHAYADALAAPGLADLTSHVQFAGLARKARAAGLAADGPMPQGEFLGRLGIVERAARLMAANPDRVGEIEAAVQRLISPTGMGQHFKVLAVRSSALPAPAPFG